MPVIILQKNGATLQPYPLQDGVSLTIGSADTNDMVLGDAAVAGQQARIASAEDGFEIQDLAGQGNTTVNGTPVTARPLLYGDKIGIGPFELLFSAKSPAADPGTEAENHDDARIHKTGGPRQDSLESTVVMEMLENMPSHIARGLVYILVLVVLVGFLYSYFGKMDIVVQARGKLIPEGEAEVVQSATSGLLKSLYAKEGDIVSKGALLVELDVTRTNVENKKRQTQLESKLKELNCLETALRIMKTVLAGETVEIDDTAVLKICSGEYVASILGLKAARMGYDKSMMQAQKMYPASLMTLSTAVRNKKLNLSSKKNQLAAAIRDLERTRSQYELYTSMYDQGLASKVKLLEEQKKFDEATAKVGESEVEVDSARGELEDAEVKLATTRVSYATATHQAKTQYELAVLKYNNQIKTMQDKLEDLKIALADFNLESTVQEQQTRFNRITAPVAGRVAFVKLRTPGELVKIGDTLFLINPVDRPLVAKINIPNKSIGRVQSGMKVKIKLDAYPYQHYGVLAGKVSRVAPDSKLVGNAYFYEAIVSLDRDYVVKNKKRYTLFTGLTLQAEIVVERRRIIENFLDPIKKLTA